MSSLKMSWQLQLPCSSLYVFPFLVAFALLLCGCGSNGIPIAPVTGSVMTCDGKPAAGGKVVFHPMGNKSGQAGISGRESRAIVNEDGTFELLTLPTMREPSRPGAVVGEHRVTFEMPRTRPLRLTSEDKEGLSPEFIKEQEAKLASMPVYSAIKCSNKIETPTVTVVDGDNVFSLTLAPK